MSKPKNSIIEDVAPNLIPMVDIMFLLLLFFMIRADAAAPFGLVQRAMNACAQVRIYKVECGSAMPPEAKQGAAMRG